LGQLTKSLIEHGIFIQANRNIVHFKFPAATVQPTLREDTFQTVEEWIDIVVDPWFDSHQMFVGSFKAMRTAFAIARFNSKFKYLHDRFVTSIEVSLGELIFIQ